MRGNDAGKGYDLWRESDGHKSPEQALAIAKIHQMMMDLLKISGGSKEYNHNVAHRWFFENSDAEWWFEMAGLIYERHVVKIKDLYTRYQYERPELLKWLKNHLRAEAGTGKRYEERKRYRQKVKSTLTGTARRGKITSLTLIK